MFGLYSCAPQPKEIIWEKTEQFIIVGINPPKHFYLDLKRVSDGEVFTSVYISKHCGGWRNCISEGDTINVTYGKYKRGDYIREELDRQSIKKVACYCNQK